jgi:HSP20 family protein
MKVRDLIPWSSAKRDVATRHQDTSPVRALQLDINRAFDDFWRAFQLPILGAWDEDPDKAVPSVDVRDTGKAVEVVAELPGMQEADIDVSVAEGALTIRGEKKSEREEKDKGYLLRERSFGRIERVVPLPDGLDVNAASAAFKNGVLTVTIPKTQEAQAGAKRIAVQQA